MSRRDVQRRRLDALESRQFPAQPVACALPHETDAEANARLGLPPDAPVIRVSIVDSSTPQTAGDQS